MSNVDKEKSKCYSCGGKGFYTQMHGTNVIGDFIGDKNYKDEPRIHKYPCKSCNGTGIASTPEICKEEKSWGQTAYDNSTSPGQDREWPEKIQEIVYRNWKNDDEVGLYSNLNSYITSLLSQVKEKAYKEGREDFAKMMLESDKGRKKLEEEARTSAFTEIEKVIEEVKKKYPAIVWSRTWRAGLITGLEEVLARLTKLRWTRK